MKNNVLDRFSKTSRLRARLDEINDKVSRRQLPRMDGGDDIGRHIVANLLALPQRTREESQLLFEAQRTRAVLYHESSGATALEATEALSEARAALLEFDSGVSEYSSLVKPAWSILQDLISIGSRRNAWTCFDVLFDAMEVSDEHRDLRPKMVNLFINMTEVLVEQAYDQEVIDVLLKMCEWTRTYVPDDFPHLVTQIPQILSASLEEITTESALRAYLYAGHLCVAFDDGGDSLGRLTRRLIENDHVDTEARRVYQEYLAGTPGAVEELEDDLQRLGYANPDPEIPYDPDRDAVNVMLTKYYEDRPWVWRNRALMLRRRGDGVGALACLARAMSISGEPPEIMGLLAPVLVGMGFVQTAYHFSRFVSPELRGRFHLNVLDLIVAEPGTARGKQRLVERLERAEAEAGVPAEFRTPLWRRRAELLFELGEIERAAPALRRLLARDPADEMAAVKLAEIAFRQGDEPQAYRLLDAKFGTRSIPFVEHLKSRMAESSGNLQAAFDHNQSALEQLSAARETGRDDKQRGLMEVHDRVVKMMGEDYGDGALVAMLQMETFVAPHRDLELLEPILERRAIDLSMQAGDIKAARHVIKDLISRHPAADTDVFVVGVRASLRSGRLEEAAEFIAKAEAQGHTESAELALLRGLLAVREGEIDKAEDWLDIAMSRVPTAEGRLALAAIRVDGGREAEAIEVLRRYRSEEGGTPEIKRRLFDLRGRLLERAGQREEALRSYLDAVDALDGWSEARRRAGLLSVELGLDHQGHCADEARVQRGLALLEGFNDSESVTREALARAALERTAVRAASVLETTLKRTDNEPWLHLQLVRLSYLVAAKDDAGARAAIESTLDDARLSPDLRKGLQSCLAALIRRMAIRRMATLSGGSGRELKEIAAEITRAQKLGEQEEFRAVSAILARVTGEKTGDVTLRKSAPLDLVLAAAVARPERLAQRTTRDKIAGAASEPDDGVPAVVARLLHSLANTDESCDAVLAAVDEFDATELSLPYARLELLRVSASRALRRDDSAALDRVLGRAPGQLESIRLFRRLKDITESSREDDTSSLLGVLAELDRTTRTGDGPLLGERLTTIRNRITALKETPSPAWASARLRTAGKRTRLHVPAVLKFWEGCRDDEELGGEARHHVALMRLSAAHECESDGVDAADLWRSAHEAWADLLEHDGFWRELAARIDGEGDRVVERAVEQVRGDVAGWILRGQLTLAKKRLFGGNVPAAIEHGRIVAHSPLLAMAGEDAIRSEICRVLSGDLERHLQNRRYDEALACIDHVIVADPENPDARCEMIRVGATVMGRSLHVIDSLTSPPDESMVRDTCELLARVLVTAEPSIIGIAAQDEIDPDLAPDLAVCLRALAYVAFHRNGDPEEACRLTDRAIEVMDAATRDSSRLRRFRSEIGLTVVEQHIKEGTNEIPIVGADDPFEQALVEVDRLLALDPDNVRVISQKARILMASNRDEEAESLARDLFDAAQRRSEPSEVRAAVELLHQVQAGRDRFRYESKMDMVDRLIEKRNWRAALDLFKETIVGRENEPQHLVKHIDILLGLHKVDRAEAYIEQLRDCTDLHELWQSRKARLMCIKYMAAAGGDLYSAFELHERRAWKEAAALCNELLAQDEKNAAAQFLTAVSLRAMGEEERAAKHRQLALRGAKKPDMKWVRELLELERGSES